MSDPEPSRRKGNLTLSSLKRTFKLYHYVRPFQGMFLLGLLFLFLSAGANLAFPKYLGDLVNAAQAEDFLKQIDRIALTLAAILVGQALFSFLRIILFVRVTEYSLAALRQATYAHLIRLPMLFFNEKRVGELNSRISADISTLQETFTTTLAEFIRQIVVITGGLALLVATSAKLTLFMLAVLPAVMIITVIFGRFIRRYSKDVQKQVAESNTIVEETLQGIAVVKSFANEFFEMRRYRNKTNEVAQTGIKGGIYRGAFASFVILGLFGSMVAVIWMGTRLIAEGAMDTGQLFSFVIYSGFIGGSIGGLADVYARIQKAIGATEELLDILDVEPEPVQETEALAEPINGAVAFSNVIFAYPTRPDVPVIRNLSLNIPAGEQLALVGPSGGGKSTLVSLLLQFYQPQGGRILIDDKPAAEYELHHLRNQMAVVPQDVLLFGGTIRENIAYGKPEATDEEVEQAAREANAHEFISRFPEGYATLVGERGVQLSGGQRQRIAIARALLKNPRILLLDEATSALDSESERLVQEALERLMRGRTSLIIAHRLATVRNAHRIAVIRDGQVEETGTHEELLATGGLYRQLSELQFTTA